METPAHASDPSRPTGDPTDDVAVFVPAALRHFEPTLTPIPSVDAFPTVGLSQELLVAVPSASLLSVTDASPAPGAPSRPMGDPTDMSRRTDASSPAA
eukprot:5827231-Pyramimonas_sp.AAC.1